MDRWIESGFRKIRVGFFFSFLFLLLNFTLISIHALFAKEIEDEIGSPFRGPTNPGKETFTKTPRKRKSNSIINKKTSKNSKPPVDRTTHSHSDGFAINKRVEKKREAIFILEPLPRVHRNPRKIYDLVIIRWSTSSAPLNPIRPPIFSVSSVQCPSRGRKMEPGHWLAKGSPSLLGEVWRRGRLCLISFRTFW